MPGPNGKPREEHMSRVLGQRGSDNRRQNLSLVFRSILRQGALPRAEIVRSTGMSAATVTTLTGRLLEAGLLVELPPETSAVGRPRVPLGVASEAFLTVGVHLGPRQAGVSLVRLDGTELASVLVNHEGMSPRKTMNRIVATAEALLAEHGGAATVLGTGIATGGTVDRDRGVVVRHEKMGWAKPADLDALTGSRLPRPLVIEKNTRAAAQYELLYGHGRGVDNFVLLLVTADTGAVIVQDRRIMAGVGQAAGDVAHLPVADDGPPCECGRRGCLAVVATDDALTADARRALKSIRTIDDVIDKAAAGHPKISELLETRSRYVGRAAATLIDLVDPSLLLIMGTVAETPTQLSVVREEVTRAAAAGADAAERVVLTHDLTFMLALAAAAPVVESMLQDPPAHLLALRH